MAAVKDLLIVLEEKYSRMGDSQLLTLERSLPRGGFDYDVVMDVLRERGYFLDSRLETFVYSVM